MEPANNLEKHQTMASVATLAFILCLCGAALAVAASPPFQATGFKVGEVTDTTAIVWTRLTSKAQPNPLDGPMVKLVYGTLDPEFEDKKTGPDKHRKVTPIRYPEGMSVADIRDAAPGAPGQVRILHKKTGTDDWHQTKWMPVNPDRDYTRQFVLENLAPKKKSSTRIA